jgi:hypothetical protein
MLRAPGKLIIKGLGALSKLHTMMLGKKREIERERCRWSEEWLE